MSNIEMEIKSLASQAARLSKEAQLAFAEEDFTQGRSLMRQAVDAGRSCQNLIKQHLGMQDTPLTGHSSF